MFGHNTSQTSKGTSSSSVGVDIGERGIVQQGSARRRSLVIHMGHHTVLSTEGYSFAGSLEISRTKFSKEGRL